PLNSVGTINYADALIAHFGQAFQRRAKSAPSAACVEAALNDLRALRKRGFALIDRHPRLGALVSA
ncbi:MAG: hypothetical protein KDB07_06270, partial [Planctomycetes bacterium]|nr:hypothetical protein [Planctomycetota bacterium]